jgi:GDSL-like Lipase/Acylhydrolase family
MRRWRCCNREAEGNTLCAHLFAAATPVGQSAPADTIQASLNIVLNPTLNVGTVYQVAAAVAVSNDILIPIAASSGALDQIESMAQMARSAGIQVILCELPPATYQGVDYSPQIATFNAALIDFAASNNYLLVDYNTPLLGQPQDFIDGIHPNAAGYTLMEAALSAVLVQ